MAATAKKIVGVSEDSCSSDDEVLRRCQEAVWETRSDTKKDGGNMQQSKRIVVADHDHDGNELQVTQGFRTHVAKKLGNLLDSRFTEMKTETESCAESAKCDNDDDDDEGFLLFSTSVPGQAAVEAPAPVRRRPISSSSDSDSEMEMRLREAAVSIKDLLPSFSLPSTLSTPSSELPCSEDIKEKKNVVEEKENHVVKKKKKKKRKRKQEKGEQVDSAGSPVNDEHGNSGQEHTQVKVKRKKKKKRHTEEEV
ncbi:protein CUSTOS [Gymnodraco acuticeps]|uniref:Protein CUSTOS n=1 Tax=Gymnodraco acuticeps TaxID=8218 RepID=A0A6P8UB04_GYMAC|nr:protein CUSTOS [Gymnodraco acuticeps]